MEKQYIKEAKQIFDKYKGNYYQMKREGVYDVYKSYEIPKEIEKQWVIEKQTEVFQSLMIGKSNKIIAESFAQYGHNAVQIKDESAIVFMMDYVYQCKESWDSNTTFRNINAILSSLHVMKDSIRKKEVIEKCIGILKEITIENIEISDDYKEDGEMPVYLSKEKILSNIQGTIEYWKDILRTKNY